MIVAVVTSEMLAAGLTLLVVVVLSACVVLVRRTTGRTGWAALACGFVVAGVVAAHLDGEHGKRTENAAAWLLPASAAMLVALRRPARSGWMPRARRLAFVLVGGWALGLLQVYGLVTVRNAVHPWMESSHQRFVLTVENASAHEVAVDFRREVDGRKVEPDRLVVPPGRTQQRDRFLDGGPCWCPVRPHSGTLEVRVGSLASRALPGVFEDSDHLVVRVDETGEVWLRTGRDGCFGAPSLGDERALEEIASVGSRVEASDG